jgi:low affinity Fe/Cu permease
MSLVRNRQRASQHFRLGQGFVAATPLLAAANLGVSVAGFAMVLQQLNHISDQIRSVEAKVDRISHKEEARDDVVVVESGK